MGTPPKKPVDGMGKVWYLRVRHPVLFSGQRHHSLLGGKWEITEGSFFRTRPESEGEISMKLEKGKYRAMVSSDWNECLAPTNPFDPISFVYPDLEPQLAGIFREYTGNRITLSEATGRISRMLPSALSEEQMDAYLDAHFAAYRGVPQLIEWCNGENILFVINTTGMQGYFQRVFRKALLPDGPVVCANPMVAYEDDVLYPMYEVIETQDKGTNTETIMRSMDLSPDKVIVVGDSGGDGPHFEWGASAGATLIGSMTKWSLEKYCRQRRIPIHVHFGITYGQGEKRDVDQEMAVDFMELAATIGDTLNRKG
jgi:2-hydroxy-3-keto-5-methylthiopentenyl-1-phosphate phosphatase